MDKETDTCKTEILSTLFSPRVPVIDVRATTKQNKINHTATQEIPNQIIQ